MPHSNARNAQGRRPDAAKRAAIMAAAQRLFAEHGFTATSMDAVARLAGASKLTAYRHFGSKDELFAAAISARCEAMLPVADDPKLAVADAESALVSFGEAFLRLILHPDALAIHRLIIAERERAPQLGPIFHDAAIVPTQLRLALLITRLHLPVSDPHIAATDLLALWRSKPMLPVEMGLPHWDMAACHAHIARTVRLCLAGWPDVERQ
jgi:TetR/AcrR family transcriptional regulator, mexJK operon transcriptional repressor